jgi:hypothetical protein
MDCTDRHERYFLRLISKNTLLYTEMVVDEAINRGLIRPRVVILALCVNVNLPVRKTPSEW